MTTTEAAEPDNDRVAHRLYLAARYHARAAQTRASSLDYYDRMDAAYHAGSAVELIAKAALARLDSRVLVKGLATHHALLDTLVEHHGRPGFAPKTTKLDSQTIDASVAIELVHRLIPECRPHRGAADKARVVRNGAVHMATFDDAGLGDVIAGMLEYVNAAVPATQDGADELWGAGVQDEWERLRRVRLERIEKTAKVKQIVARERFRELVAELTDTTREAFIADRSKRAVSASDEQWQVECPACELPYAWLMWDADYEPVREEDGWTYDGGLALTGLLCPICTLDLNADEVGALDVDTELDHEIDIGPDEDR